MADYYPVLKRAISSLPSTSGEARRAVYEKARSALLKQLQSYDPPLSPAEVTDQRLALEESIRRVESETAGAAFGLVSDAAPAGDRAPSPAHERPVPPPATERAPVERPVPPPPATEPSSPSAKPDVAPKPETPPRMPERSSVADDSDARTQAPGDALPQRVTVRVPPPASTQPLPPEERKPAESEPKIEAGLSAFTRTLRQAEALGGASSQAVRSARGAIEEPVGPEPGPAPADRKIEPDFGSLSPRRADPVPPTRVEPVVAADPQPEPQPAAEAAPVRRTRPAPAERKRAGRAPLLVAAALLLVAVLAGGGYAAWLFLMAPGGTAIQPEVAIEQPVQAPAAEPEPAAPAAVTEAEDLEPKILDRLPQEGVPAEPVAPDARPVQTETLSPVITEPGIPAPPAGETPIVAEATPPAAAAPAAESPPAEPAPAVDVPAPAEPTPATPAEAVPAAAPAEAAASAETAEPQVLVAQRAILYEEPIPGSEGSRQEGRVLWSFVNEPVLPGDPPTPQLRADIEIPDRDIRVLMSIRKNADEALPASHIVELRFQLPPGFAGTAIETTPGLILKQTEDARGDPLIGAVAKVSDNLFWLALSGLDQDAARNVALMKQGEWIDIPIRYLNRRRAILTFEKGGGGEAAFRQAFEAWGQ